MRQLELARRRSQAYAGPHDLAGTEHVDLATGTAEMHPSFPCCVDAGSDTSPDRLSLPFGHQNRHFRHQLARRRRGVDSILHTDEGASSGESIRR